MKCPTCDGNGGQTTTTRTCGKTVQGWARCNSCLGTGRR